ncbi:geranylgeranyl reductase family protein [Algoriphagus ratkowskyi]|uniref:Geranylgeranyl reductase family protein n=1 Tax=Algoriphagus ratkowskyi TaxID=57028 RepID=A0A2W7RT04_9BACT|nr:geranylgeranyl reductase family protein [Algoriphagus ratkowskyi]PZX57659.1 geranylgeranyl reductase family protein [Algoriphagus ratkowskyi]TXD78930.1 geranylgeranyl reductase family protein [Algoriphagus ratkowskyi]
MSQYDVAIIGGGPSGALAAYYLAKKGIAAVIIEKENLPRYKTCGGGLVFRGRRKLPFDISSVVEREFDRMNVYMEGEQKVLTSIRDVPVISMVMRDKFDNFLIDKAIEAGAELRQGHKLTAITFGEILTLHTSQGDIQAKLLIAADGVLSPTAKLAGWKETRQLIPALEYEVEVNAADFERLSKEVRFDMDSAPSGYAWSFPKKTHLSLGIAATKRSRINLKAYYKKYLDKLGIKEILSEKAHGYQIPISPRTDGFYRKNIFLIGDAAGLADPVTAEGISNSFWSAELVTEAIFEAKLNAEKAGALYEQKLAEELLPELKTSQTAANWFYGYRIIRNLLLRKYGDYAIDFMTDLYIGNRGYPKNLIKTIKRKITETKVTKA